MNMLVCLMVFIVANTGDPVLRGELSSFKQLGTPSIQRNVSYINTSDASGWRCYWDNTGHRNLGQQFTVDTAFDASTLALKVNSTAPSWLTNRPFRLTISRQVPGSYQPGDEVAVFEGLVPSEVPTSESWLILEFPNVHLSPGDYCFVIQFTETGPSGQQIVFRVGSQNAYPGGSGLYSASSSNPDQMIKGYPFNFILSEYSASDPRILEVDQRGGTAYVSIASAVGDLRPGDTLRIAPGSGPYREKLYISTSGTAAKPIVVEGNNEVVTGFEPLTGFVQSNGVWVCTLPFSFPVVLTYNGERLRQDAATSQFTSYALLSPDETRIELLAGVDTNGWEISSRYFAVQIQNISHHIYRNLKASGATNDGFNLHGAGTNIVFENIVGFQNLDEGFSSHDQIHSEVHQGEFFDNDNGVGNIESSVTILEDISIHDNLGWGLWLRHCTGELTDVVVQDNGLRQVYLQGTTYAQITNVVVITPSWTSRQWTTYKESANDSTVKALHVDGSTVVDGQWDLQ